MSPSRRPRGFQVGTWLLAGLLTGVDILRDATLNIYTDTADEKFFPPESLSRMVAAGDLGRKSGRGFYTYDA